MSLTMTIVMLIAGWLAVATAMLWECCELRGAIIILSKPRWWKRQKNNAYATQRRIRAKSPSWPSPGGRAN
ncbi:hypothetical protein PYV50_13140 [Pseudomonas sp. H22_DOA]|nr:hypothetical protein PYV50_13140 [Pseudomonas sp. H22_DOA]